MFGLAILALVRETGLQLARSVLNDALGKALATLLLGWPFGDAIALTSELARGIAKIDTCTSGSRVSVDTCTSGSGFSVDTCTLGSGFSVDIALRSVDSYLPPTDSLSQAGSARPQGPG